MWGATSSERAVLDPQWGDGLIRMRIGGVILLQTGGEASMGKKKKDKKKGKKKKK
jgi:hypothetical protein